jgi:hypothetical protein
LKTVIAGGALAIAIAGIGATTAHATPAAAGQAVTGQTAKPAAVAIVRSGTVFRAGHGLWSPNKRYALLMQSDGNAVIYRASDKVPLWSSETRGHRGAYLDFEANGNLVVFDRAHKPLWMSNTAGHAGSYLLMQNDGNLVIYSHGKKALWAWQTNSTEMLPGEMLTPGHSRLSHNRKYRLQMQTDGNLVLLQGKKALWNSGTYGHPGATFSFQHNGNLVIHSVKGTVLWQSGTHGTMTRLLVQDDGNLVLYHGKIAHWSTKR